MVDGRAEALEGRQVLRSLRQQKGGLKEKSPLKSGDPRAIDGGGKETRTPDPYAASVMLYQLSYAPVAVGSLHARFPEPFEQGGQVVAQGVPKECCAFLGM